MKKTFKNSYDGQEIAVASSSSSSFFAVRGRLVLPRVVLQLVNWNEVSMILSFRTNERGRIPITWDEGGETPSSLSLCACLIRAGDQWSLSNSLVRYIEKKKRKKVMSFSLCRGHDEKEEGTHLENMKNFLFGQEQNSFFLEEEAQASKQATCSFTVCVCHLKFLTCCYGLLFKWSFAWCFNKLPGSFRPTWFSSSSSFFFPSVMRSVIGF